MVVIGLALVGPLLPAVPSSAAAAACDGRPATIVGTAGDDLLFGTEGDDVIVGLEGDDTISALGGNDVVCGDGGRDRLGGFAGDDRIFGGLDSDAGGDVIWPGVGNDYVDAGLDPLTRDNLSVPADTVTYTDLLGAGFPGGITADLSPPDGVGVVAEPSGTDQVLVTEAVGITGTRTADVLIGSPYADVLIGRGGADRIDGAGGNDSLASHYTDTDVDPAADAPDDIEGGPGVDWIALGQAGGTARGGDDADHLEAHPTASPVVLSGDDGDDELVVDSAADVEVEGGRGHDDITVRLHADSSRLSVDGGGSRDLVTIDVRGAGIARGTPVTVDLGRGVLRTTSRVGSVRGLEVLWIKGGSSPWRVRGTHRDEDVIMRGGRSLEASMRGGRDSVVATRGRDLLDLGAGRRDFANGRGGNDTCTGAERVRSCENRRRTRTDRDPRATLAGRRIASYARPARSIVVTTLVTDGLLGVLEKPN